MTKMKTNCVYCKKEFEYNQKKSRARWPKKQCSIECRRVYEKKNSHQKTTCQQCNEEFTYPKYGRKRKFCSLECRQSNQKEKQEANLVKQCIHCGNDFQCKNKSEKQKRNYCNDECKRQYNEEQPRGLNIVTNCKHCKSEIVHSARHKRVFCNRDCQKAYGRRNSTKTNCEKCGDKFEYSQKNGINRRFCSQKCRQEFESEKSHLTGTCAACGNEFSYRAYDHNRICCNQKCYNEYYKNQTKTSTCVSCGNGFDHPANSSSWKYCDGCRKDIRYTVTVQERKITKRKCVGCGENFEFRPYSEKDANERSYCSRRCITNHKLEIAIENDSMTKRQYKRYFRERVEHKCSNCGIREHNNKPLTLDIDHIDGNNQNHSLDNLRQLCPNCHSQTPTYRNYNVKLNRKKNTKRKYGSHENRNSDLLNRLNKPSAKTSICHNCGSEFKHRPRNKVKYCSNKCCGDHRKQLRKENAIEIIKNDGIVKFWEAKEYIIEKDGYKCSECGISEWNGKPLTLECHHIDGVKKNNRVSNLKMLCVNCHSQTDNYKKIKTT